MPGTGGTKSTGTGAGGRQQNQTSTPTGTGRSRSGRRKPKGGQRETEPKGWSPFQSYSLGIIPRRKQQRSGTFANPGDLEDWASSHPMKALRLMLDAHPSVGLAAWNALRLTCPGGKQGLRLVAFKKGANGEEEPNASDTTSLDEMFNNLSPEVGGLIGLQTTLTLEALFTGLVCAEGVPGPRGTGLQDVWPVDGLTIEFGRKERGGRVTPYQIQLYPEKAPARTRKKTEPSLNARRIELNTETFKHAAIDSDVDDPYGRAPYATALSEAMADIALMQDLRDAVHNAAWPRLDVGVDLKMLHEVAVTVYRITDPKAAAKWVNDRFQEVVSYIGDLYADDNVVHHSTGKVNVLQPGGFQGLEPVLTFLRQRIVQALKTLPTLMGINEGSSTNVQSVEWQIYAQGLETLREIVAGVLVQIGDLHLRLIGSTSRCKAVYEPIRTNDALVDANTENIRIMNSQNSEKLGYLSHDEASEKAVGKKAYGPAKPGVLEGDVAADGSQKNRPDNGGGVKGTRNSANTEKKPGAGGGHKEGTTTDERNARKP